MATDLFVTPKNVIERLKYWRDTYTNFNFKIAGAGEYDVLTKQDAAQNVPRVCLHVMNGNSQFLIISNNGEIPQAYQNNINIVLSVITKDIRAQQADEFGAYFKEFIWKALHSWGTDEIPGGYKLLPVSDTPLGVDGHAVYFHQYNCVQTVELRGCAYYDETGQDWDSLPWFLSSDIQINFENQDGSDNSIFATTEQTPV